MVAQFFDEVGGVGNVGFVCSEDLAGDRTLARHCLEKMSRRRGSMGKPRGGHHLGIGEIRPALGTHPAERRIRKPGKRCKDVLHLFDGFGCGRIVSAGSE